MESISIKKFDFGRSFLVSDRKNLIFNLVERNGKEVTFNVLNGKKDVMKVSGVVKVVFENGVAQEVVRVDIFDAFVNLKAMVSKVGKKKVVKKEDDGEVKNGDVISLDCPKAA